MENLIITDWDGIDSVSFYTYQSVHHALIYSAEHHLWVANSYHCCKSMLSNKGMRVPQPAWPATLNGKAALMLDNLARINNDEKHPQARKAAILLYEQIKKEDISGIIAALLTGVNHSSFDWVSVVCKRLPVFAIAKGLSFTDEDSDWMASHMAELNKVMLPAKTDEDVVLINNVIDHYYKLAMDYIDNHALTHRLVDQEASISKQEAMDLLVCNLLGLFIQSYDACRALLTISVTTLARLETVPAKDDVFYQKLMNELLRIDPPVHNTRRIAVGDIYFGGQVIKAGQTVLVVMGAANMDDMVFDTPEHFDIERGNNAANMTFGLGGHACIAKYFCIDLAIATCRYLTDHFDGIKLLPQEITYEPQLNVKMAKQLMVSLGADRL